MNAMRRDSNHRAFSRGRAGVVIASFSVSDRTRTYRDAVPIAQSGVSISARLASRSPDIARWPSCGAATQAVYLGRASSWAGLPAHKKGNSWERAWKSHSTSLPFATASTGSGNSGAPIVQAQSMQLRRARSWWASSMCPSGATCRAAWCRHFTQTPSRPHPGHVTGTFSGGPHSVAQPKQM